MTIYATSRPLTTTRSGHAVCTRCGIDYSTRRWPGPDCRDCRDLLNPPTCGAGHIILGVNFYRGQCGACKRAWKATRAGRTVTDCCAYAVCKCQEVAA